jgi:hypothetical protein
MVMQFLANPGRVYSGLVHRIIAAITKRMTTQNPPDGHEKTTEGSMAFNGINGILGTGGSETACRGKQGRNQELICSYKK